MANNSHVNKYAKSLFVVSSKSNDVGDVRDGLDSIVKISKSIPEFNHLLFTKNISRQDKLSILSNLLNGKVNSLVVELLIVLIENDDMQLFIDILNKYSQLMNANSMEVNVSIISNIELSSEKLNSIKDNLSQKLNKQINIKSDTNRSLLGGLQLRIGNTIIDNSLSNKLMKLKNNLKNNHANME